MTSLLLIILVILLVGGGYGYRSGFVVGASPLGVLLIVLIVIMLVGLVGGPRWGWWH